MGRRGLALACLLALGAGCDSETEPDGGAMDAAATDAGAVDGGPMDALPSPWMEGGPERDAGYPWDGAALDAGPPPVRGVFTHIAAGGDHTCGISGGHVYCWGKNSSGQLGDLTFEHRTTPVAVPWIDDAVELALGSDHSCARTATGAVYCWGSWESGALGDGTELGPERADELWVPGRPWPGLVSGLSDAISLVPSRAGACAERASGGFVCWGWMANRGVRVPTPLEDFGEIVAISMQDHACARVPDGRVACLGYAYPGNGSPAGWYDTPQWVTGIDDAVEVDVDSSHTCVRRESDEVLCWGYNDHGQVGDGTLGTDRALPRPVSISDVTALALGGWRTCALRRDGTVHCWGFNDGGIGDGTLTDRPSPTPVAGLRDVVELAAGGAHMCALSSDGTVRCWGRNQYGELGAGWTWRRPDPVPIVGPSDMIAVSASYERSCGLRAGGTAYCWGRNRNGEVGDGTRTARSLPTPVVGVDDFVSIDVGASHACGVRATGRVACWGQNADGAVGDGTTTLREIPTEVVGLTDAVSVSGGFGHTCAVRATGGVVCWGNNRSHQVGPGGAPQVLTPVEVPGLDSVEAVVAHRDRTCALREGRVLCWGWLWGFAAPTATPTEVTGLTDAVRLDPVSGRCAVRRGGDVVCWDEDPVAGTHSPGPTPVTGTDVVSDESVVCVRGTDGAWTCWGARSFRARVEVREPRGLAGVTSMALGDSSACALQDTGQISCWGLGIDGELGDRELWVPQEVVAP